jgi:hypothetical protein
MRKFKGGQAIVTVAMRRGICTEIIGVSQVWFSRVEGTRDKW